MASSEILQLLQILKRVLLKRDLTQELKSFSLSERARHLQKGSQRAQIRHTDFSGTFSKICLKRCKVPSVLPVHIPAQILLTRRGDTRRNSSSLSLLAPHSCLVQPAEVSGLL